MRCIGVQRKSSRALAAVLASIILFATACNPNAPCNWENRSVQSNGYLGPVGAREVGASISVVQIKGHSDQDRLGWNMWTDLYAGHVTGAVMYEASNPIRVLATFPILQTNQPIFANDPSLPATITTSYGDLYSILVANGARLKVTTDIAAHATLDVPLVVYSHNDWAKMGCYA